MSNNVDHSSEQICLKYNIGLAIEIYDTFRLLSL